MNELSWDLRARLRTAIGTYGVPGASIAVFRGETLHEAAAGILNAETGVEATTDSLFHIASVTKPITATIAMQLADEGKLELEAPVRRYLPDFRVASAAASERVTVRQLLCHASGIDGDFFHDTTRGEDRIAKVVEAGRSLPQLHDPGHGFSYCNHGFTILGRIFEVIEGSDFDTIWRTRISEKLGTPSLLTLTREALRYRVAVGHVAGNGGLRVPRRLFLSPSQGPAGGTPMARARDLVSFALMHLNDGIAREGARMLSAGAVRAMREPNNALPARQLATHFGLGWMLLDWVGQRLFGHDGLSIFQRSYLRVFPEKRVVFALLTNGGDGSGLFRALASEVFGEAGVTMTPPVAALADQRVDAARYVGTYARRSTVSIIGASNGQLTLSSTWTDEWARELYGTQGPFPLEPAGGDIFLWRVPGVAEAPVVHFLDPDANGRFRTVHAGLRMNHRQ
jgi:CubicO group peptidase (beta-lactamase class C family)